MGSMLREVCANYDTMVKLGRELEHYGLINIRTVQRPYLTNFYTLTEKGKKVAEHLRHAEEIIGNA